MSTTPNEQRKAKAAQLPATWRQLALLDALSISYGPNTTRGEASKLITEAQEDEMPWECDFYQ